MQRHITVGRGVLDLQLHLFEMDGKVVKLTEKETQLIELLSQRPTQTVRFRQLMGEIWGDERKPEGRLLAMIELLRRKMDSTLGAQNFIEDSQGIGLSERFSA